MAVKITGITKNSPAEKVGIKAGESLVSIDGNVINDVLDYMFYAAESVVSLSIETSDGPTCIVIEKSEYDDLGLEFSSFLMDDQRACKNNCIFCFIDQMPPNMRETLYFKDDDARLSFLQGNYVTLTNLEQNDIDRIINMRLNVNVSVHTTNRELRCKMMNNRFAGEKLDYLEQLSDAGILLNCQIVLCPGWNDGDELKHTIMALARENVQSIAVVPVGLTKWREGLTQLRSVDKACAVETIDIIEKLQTEFLRKYDTRMAYASDEFYLKAERELPRADAYEDYPQFENGVGMLRSLTDEFEQALEETICEIKPRRISLVTGTLCYANIVEMVEKAEKKWYNLSCKVFAIKNNFFGETITVAGLLTAEDIIEQLKGEQLCDELLLPRVMLRSGEDVFLDDKTLDDVSKALSVKIRTVGYEGEKLLEALIGI